MRGSPRQSGRSRRMSGSRTITRDLHFMHTP
jgi:hypothetical protein